MDNLIGEHLKETGAVVPLPNPDFDPEQYRPELIGKQLKKRSVTPDTGK